ncbi:hypothetical protein ALQ33_00041 [Pseudomonas syringae pv. philadelphi]|uniref:Uncharacterized protein n=1 Tax=Pseudomonas syringae pv. philadelphi TaxID=251706 RepID=A0A3M3ZTH8_9PSED|nr:hypothetical protein ALQ33_00041 [Pseudomonas syringae pv. philadelphi]
MQAYARTRSADGTIIGSENLSRLVGLEYLDELTSRQPSECCPRAANVTKQFEPFLYALA